ncbi:MAG: redox-regulated ATPase YchF [Methanocellales archaeon]|nr:redox-regulated ATPase YchF [Methanocellales archaeon]
MTVSIGLAGKPNSGKSTFFKAATLVDVEIASYPFTTVDANHGMSHVRTKCPCKELKLECNNCIDGDRFVPVELVDVAGLVPDAHLGKGLGNEFLDNLRQTQAIIHVVDASGGTDAEGNLVEIGTRDPVEDVRFLEKEMTMWMYGIIKRHWAQLTRKIPSRDAKIERILAERLMGVGANEVQIKVALHNASLEGKITDWSDEDLLRLADEIRKVSKPMTLAANKIDIAPEENIKRLTSLENESYIVVLASAAAELALRMADKKGVIKYLPGDANFQITAPEELTSAQKEGLERIRTLMKKYGSTGVQQCIDKAIFGLLDHIVIYPVEDENKFTDKDGNVLPDAFLMKRGGTAHDMAYMVHTDLGEGFLYAVDAKTKRRISEEHVLQDGDIIKIVSTK